MPCFNNLYNENNPMSGKTMAGEKTFNLGERLRRLRKEQQNSIRSLASKSGISANALSQIERGMTSPTVSTLYKLADALDIPVTAFFGVDEEKQDVILARARQSPRVPIVKGTWEGRGGEKFTGRVEPFVLTLEVGANSGSNPMLHTGHEFVFCFGGSVEYKVEDRSYLLNPGDSLLFAAHLNHEWRNAGKTTANLLIVLSGFAEMDKPMKQHLHQKSGTAR